VRTLVDPLLGGINAGDADRLSLRASAPQLAEAAARHRSLIVGLRRQRREASPGPVFHSLPGGMARLIERLAASLGGTEVRLRTAVEGLSPAPNGRWRLHVANETDALVVDAVVLATPAPVSAAVLRDATPGVAAELAAIEHASVVLVTMAFAPTDIPRPLDASGYLVPRGEGLVTTACSWTSSKWAHLRGDRVLLRVSAGRFGDERALDWGDAELTERLAGELETVMGVRAAPSEVRVSRWRDAFPQYTPGHLDRVESIERGLAAGLPGIVVAGAAYRGVGIPACIRQGREAARAAAAAAGRAGTLVGHGEG
jgi:protoporphyrinogen/coproporphyrinogen III oxidase